MEESLNIISVPTENITPAIIQTASPADLDLLKERITSEIETMSWTPHHERCLVEIIATQETETGTPNQEAYIKASTDRAETVKKRDRLYGSTESTRSLVVEFRHATNVLQANGNNPLHTIVHDTYTSFLTEEQAKNLDYEAHQYEDLIQQLEKDNRLYGHCTFRDEARWALYRKKLEAERKQ